MILQFTCLCADYSLPSQESGATSLPESQLSEKEEGGGADSLLQSVAVWPSCSWEWENWYLHCFSCHNLERVATSDARESEITLVKPGIGQVDPLCEHRMNMHYRNMEDGKIGGTNDYRTLDEYLEGWDRRGERREHKSTGGRSHAGTPIRSNRTHRTHPRTRP